MADRRMFSKKIIDTDAFLDMPLSAQALYFHLSMRADDDGFIGNPKRIRDYVGASEDDLKLLVAKRFVLVCDSGVIVIKHWRIHNLMRGDRYHPTTYISEKAQLTVDTNGAYTERDNQMATDWQPNGNQVAPQVRLGQDRLGQDSGESARALPEPQKTTRFEKPTVDEIAAYCMDNGYQVDANGFYDYYESNGWRVGKAPMKDWRATVRNWARREKAAAKPRDEKRGTTGDKYKRED